VPLIHWGRVVGGPQVERRVMAILATDVAGYSRLIGADDEGTYARLTAHQGELLGPKIEERRRSAAVRGGNPTRNATPECRGSAGEAH